MEQRSKNKRCLTVSPPLFYFVLCHLVYCFFILFYYMTKIYLNEPRNVLQNGCLKIVLLLFSKSCPSLSHKPPLLLLLLDSIALSNRLQFWLAGCGQKSHLADYLFLCRHPQLSAAACKIKCLAFTNTPKHTQSQMQHTPGCIELHS